MTVKKSTGEFRQPLILLVDDDLIILGLLHQFLQLQHYETRMATSAGMALAMLEESKRMPDLAILDITMPGMNGFDLATLLKKHTAVPFMFLSANDDPETARRAADCGAVGFLVKPLELNQILPSVVAALARAEELSMLRRQETQLVDALHDSRENGVAIGILMERFGISRATAFERLRDHARDHRIKMSAVASALVSDAEVNAAANSEKAQGSAARMNS